MQIKELAQITGLPSKTIRYYEETGVLPQPKRLTNGYRVYDQTDVERAKFVAGARRLDLSLGDITEMVAMRDRYEAPCKVLLDTLEQQANEIALRIDEMRRLETELRQLYALGLTFPTDDVEGKNCICHLVSEIRTPRPEGE